MYNKNSNQMTNCYVWLICLMLSCVGISSWAADSQIPFVWSGSTEQGDLAPYLQVWHDVTSKASYIDAQKAYSSAKFKGIGRRGAGFGYRKSALWFRVSIVNPMSSSRDVIVSAPSPTLDELDVYCQIGQGRTHFYPLGEQTDFSRRRLKVRHYAVPMSLPSQSESTCYFRVKTSNHLSMKLTISDPYQFLERESREQIQLGVFYGVGLCLLLAIIVLYLSMKDSLYLFYALHIVGGLGYSSIVDGATTATWAYLGIVNFTLVLFIACWIIGALLFAIEFFSIQRRHPVLHKGLLTSVVSILLILFLYPWVSELQAFKTMVQAATANSVLLLGVGVYCAFRGQQRAYFFIAGWGAVSVSVCLAQLAMAGVLPDDGLTTVGLKISWIIEVMILSIVQVLGLVLMKRRESDYQKGMVTAKGETSEKSQFLAKMSHEIRTPMTGVLGVAELLEATPLSETQRRYLRAIQRSSQGMMDVVNGVLDVSKIEAGKVELKHTPIDIKGLILDCLTVFEMTARKKHIPLSSTIEAGTPLTVMGDPDRIRQVIINLLSNALKFTSNGRVVIYVSMTDQILDEHLMLKVEVRDTGIGIGNEDRARLFLPFSQIENGQSMNSDGTGLGLMICRQIVGLMSGDIGVDSVLGRGSVFWFTVPFMVLDDCELTDQNETVELLENQNAISAMLHDVAPGEELHESKFDNESEPDKTGFTLIDTVNKPSILVAEDNEINQKVILGYLERMGLVPDIVSNGREAVSNIVNAEKSYDLVLMDCEMPILDGFSATEEIFKWQDSAGLIRTPIIALSAHATDGYIQRSKEVGMLMHVAKPLSFKCFSEAINLSLNSRIL